MFREGRLVQKSKRCCKKMHVFPDHFFSVKNRYKIIRKACKTVICTKIGKKITFGTPFSSKQSIFCRFLESLWVPGGPPRTCWEPPRILCFFVKLQMRLKTSPEGSPGGSREASGRPRASSRDPPGHHFGSIWDRRCTS